DDLVVLVRPAHKRQPENAICRVFCVSAPGHEWTTRRRSGAVSDNRNSYLQGNCEAGATGLEPATSGVTVRLGHRDAPPRASPNDVICRDFWDLSHDHTAWLCRS